MKQFDIHFQAALITYFCTNSVYAGSTSSEQWAALESLFKADASMVNYATLYKNPEEYGLRGFPAMQAFLESQANDSNVSKLMACFESRMSVLMIAVKFEDWAFANYLLKHGATTGFKDNLGKSVIDFTDASDSDNESASMCKNALLHQFRTSRPKGLVVGCGHGLGACNTKIIQGSIVDSWDGNHSHLHPREHFLTVGPSEKAKADYQMMFAQLCDNSEFMRDNAARFDVVILEYLPIDVLDIVDGKSRALDAIYQLLSPNGFVVMTLGLGVFSNKRELIQSVIRESKFDFDLKPGLLCGKDDVGVIASTNSFVISKSGKPDIKPWMRNACLFAMYRDVFNASTLTAINSSRGKAGKSPLTLDELLEIADLDDVWVLNPVAMSKPAGLQNRLL